MPTIPNVPFSAIPIAAGYNPDTEVFPLDQSITVLDLTGPDATDRQHETGFKRDETLQDRVNKIIAALNSLLAGAGDGLAQVLWRDGSTTFTGPTPLGMGGNKIVNMADPTSAQDAATKAYVNAQDLLQMPRDGTRAATGDMNMGNFKITNLLDPTAAQHAVTVTYLNTALLAELPRDGSRAMTGNLDAGGHRMVNVASPTTGSDAANQSYVSTQDLLQLPRDGSRAMTGNLDAGNHKIVNLTDPSSAQDAATKAYVNAQDVLLLDLAGSRAMTGNVNMGSHKIVNVADGSSANDAVNVEQLSAVRNGRLGGIAKHALIHSSSAPAGGIVGGDSTGFTAVGTLYLYSSMQYVDFNSTLRLVTNFTDGEEWAMGAVSGYLTLTWSGTSLTTATWNSAGMLDLGDVNGFGSEEASVSVMGASSMAITLASCTRGGTTYYLMAWVTLNNPSGPTPYTLTVAYGMAPIPNSTQNYSKTRGFLSQIGYTNTSS